MLAYAARYGHQPLPVLLGMTHGDFLRFSIALMCIVRGENGSEGMKS